MPNPEDEPLINEVLSVERSSPLNTLRQLIQSDPQFSVANMRYVYRLPGHHRFVITVDLKSN